MLQVPATDVSVMHDRSKTKVMAVSDDEGFMVATETGEGDTRKSSSVGLARKKLVDISSRNRLAA